MKHIYSTLRAADCPRRNDLLRWRWSRRSPD